ncbi:DUF4834 family protein [Hymenobacter sp. CRA2]|uniref:DUF4834 family protein n=1 Tax=Hymenobacter sp. CRA2 TaxID=1955620 RepID=UPI00098F9736|nr:DUF4834 family protein [Hymenobacter sp. CRA2]OON70646.1 hypothetical protein B0919_01100 [Hymenobacter sp. CRA2]
MSFLTFLFVSFLLFWVLRLVLPYLLRYALTSLVKKQMGAGGMPFGAPFEGQAPPRYEQAAESADHVRVDYVPPKTKRQPKADFRGGDYVDFEEVK